MDEFIETFFEALTYIIFFVFFVFCFLGVMYYLMEVA